MKSLSILAALTLSTTAVADEIWVTNEKDDTVSVIDIETLEVVRTIEVGERPRGITFSKDHSVLYVCASDSDTVQVIDPESGEILHELPSGEDPEQFVLHPDDRRLYIANEDDAITTVVDTETRIVFAQMGKSPLHRLRRRIWPTGSTPKPKVSSPTRLSIRGQDTPNSSRRDQSFGAVPRSAERSAYSMSKRRKRRRRSTSKCRGCIPTACSQ